VIEYVSCGKCRDDWTRLKRGLCPKCAEEKEKKERQPVDPKMAASGDAIEPPEEGV
jgi:predicted amidophosphoribosyltransferase